MGSRPGRTLDRPARDLLARRAHGVGGIAELRSTVEGMRRRLGLLPQPAAPPLQAVPRGGWAGVELEFDQLIAAWERGVEPDPLDITYPAWREWKRNPERAAGRGRDRVRLEDSRRLEAADLGQIYRKGAARIERLLDADLPSFD